MTMTIVTFSNIIIITATNLNISLVSCTSSPQLRQQLVKSVIVN